jgi:hypothetical protein
LLQKKQTSESRHLMEALVAQFWRQTISVQALIEHRISALRVLEETSLVCVRTARCIDHIVAALDGQDCAGSCPDRGTIKSNLCVVQQ